MRACVGAYASRPPLDVQLGCCVGEGGQGGRALRASSLDEIWWLKRHADRSPNSPQRQLGRMAKRARRKEADPERTSDGGCVRMQRRGDGKRLPTSMLLFWRSGRVARVAHFLGAELTGSQLRSPLPGRTELLSLESKRQCCVSALEANRK